MRFVCSYNYLSSIYDGVGGKSPDSRHSRYCKQISPHMVPWFPINKPERQFHPAKSKVAFCLTHRSV